MADPPDNVPLGAEFQKATYAQWRKLVEAALDGRPFERLATQTYNSLKIEPLHERDRAAQPVAGRGPSLPWAVMARIDHLDPALANAEALHELENGANGLVLVCAGSAGAYGYGLPPPDAAIERALDGVHLDAEIAIEFDLSAQTKDAALALAALVERRGIAPSAVHIRFGFDPLGASVRAGGLPMPWPEFGKLAAGIVAALAARGFHGPALAADGRIVHAAGGSEAQELAFVVATATAYLRALEAHGMALGDARRQIFFRLTADADQFLTIAKFRALRKLWARVEEACGLSPAPAFIAAETAWRMMTKRDPHVNIVRTAIAAAAAGLGGADSLTVLPFTAALGLPDRFARRIARNTQLILIEEAHLAKVADPAGGSGAIENVTDALCREAWTLFQEIERAGGAAAALDAGLIQRKVAATCAERAVAMRRRHEVLVGTTDFPDLGEMPPAVLDAAPSVPPSFPAAIKFAALPSTRLAEPFERLRDASDRTLKTTGSRPKIFLANLGAPADFTPRATFAKNLFEAGGIEALTNDGFANRDAMIAAFRNSDARLACICGSDETYVREAADAAQVLRAAGASHLYLAGKPGQREAEWTAAGIRTFIFAGCDALATLEAAHDILGIDRGRVR